MSSLMKRCCTALLVPMVALFSPVFLTLAQDIDRSFQSPGYAHVEEDQQGVSRQFWDGRVQRSISQRLLWEPGMEEREIAVKYWRDGIVVVEGTFGITDEMAFWDAVVVGNHIRIERSIADMKATDDFLRVWINGVFVPAYGDWFLQAWNRLSSTSVDALENAFMTEDWVNETLGLLSDADDYLIVSQEFSELVGLWQSFLGPYFGDGTDGAGWNCFWCGVSILGYLAEVGLALAAGVPSGGAALAFWLIARYSTIAAAISTCVICATSIVAANPGCAGLQTEFK